jgi:hypothetical protein
MKKPTDIGSSGTNSGTTRHGADFCPPATKAGRRLDPDPVGPLSRPGLNENLTARQPAAQAERLAALTLENALDGRRIRTAGQYLDGPQPRRLLRLGRRKQGTALPPLRRIGVDLRPGRALSQNHGDSAVQEDHIPLELAGSRVLLHLHPARLFAQRRARQLPRQRRSGVEKQHVAHFGRQLLFLPLRGDCPGRQGHDRYQVNADSRQPVHPCMLLSHEGKPIDCSNNDWAAACGGSKPPAPPQCILGLKVAQAKARNSLDAVLALASGFDRPVPTAG